MDQTLWLGGISELFTYDSGKFYQALTGTTEDYIFIGNLKTGEFKYSPSMVTEFGLPGQVVGNAASFWGELIHPSDKKDFLARNQEITEGREDYHNIEYRARNVDGQWIWLRCRGAMLRDEDGCPELFAGLITNLSQKAQIDYTTGLFTKYEFERTIKRHLMDLKDMKTLSIMLLNVDSFKNVNDLYDRSFGDEVLRVTARRMTELLPDNATVYRLDGDEFGIIILDEDIPGIQQIFHKIGQNFQRQQEYAGKKYYCTMSAGSASYPSDGDTYLELLKHATYSLEHSKLMGKNRLTVFSGNILEGRKRRLELTELLRESVENGFAGFSIHYQPQVVAATGELVGAEALARWRCGKYGDVPPSEFIPLLEQNQLILPVGRYIFSQAVNQCRKWCRYKPDLQMSINLSYLQLAEEELISFMKEVLEKEGLAPAHIVMELTETYLAKADTVVLGCLEEMKSIGMKLAMDDFGVGYSSFVSLKNMPVDIVKIDRVFVKGITTDLFNATFIRSITELCHNVGKKICLEGVETEEEYRVVNEMGMEMIQGYLFGRPASPGHFEEQLQRSFASHD